jgi:hypothetical protein
MFFKIKEKTKQDLHLKICYHFLNHDFEVYHLGVPFRFASGQAIRFIPLRFMSAPILHAWITD